MQYFQLKSVYLNMNNTQGRVHYDNSLQLHKVSAYLSPLLLEWLKSEERDTHSAEGRDDCRSVLSLRAPRSRLLSLGARLESIPINYRCHSKMINAFYLSLRESMALLLPR